jgi:sulfite reductase (NADPH) flavoprotein alpha-component
MYWINQAKQFMSQQQHPHDQDSESSSHNASTNDGKTLSQRSGEIPHFGPAWLFFGCRNRKKDFLYNNEWQLALKCAVSMPMSSTTQHAEVGTNPQSEMGSEGNNHHHNHEMKALDVFKVAFSRDQESKEYVQHLLAQKESCKFIYDTLIKKDGYLIVAGNAKQMPKDVKQVIVAALAQEGNCSEEQAQMWLNQLANSGKFLLECWW